MKVKLHICWLLVVLVSFTAVGCKDKYVIPKKDMTKILIDLHIANNISAGDGSLQNRIISYKTHEAILLKYGYSLNDFNSALDQYMANPLVFDEIYANVVKELTSMMSAYAPAESVSDTTQLQLMITDDNSLQPAGNLPLSTDVSLTNRIVKTLDIKSVHYRTSFRGDTVRVYW